MNKSENDKFIERLKDDAYADRLGSHIDAFSQDVKSLTIGKVVTGQVNSDFVEVFIRDITTDQEDPIVMAVACFMLGVWMSEHNEASLPKLLN